MYDSGIESEHEEQNERQDGTKEKNHMWDRLYIIAYLLKAKFRHPAAKASC